jgi:hypothetical protein
VRPWEGDKAGGVERVGWGWGWMYGVGAEFYLLCVRIETHVKAVLIGTHGKLCFFIAISNALNYQMDSKKLKK